MRKPNPNLILVLTLAIAAGLVAFVIWRQDRSVQVERLGFQDADVPLTMPASGAPDSRFQFPSAWQLAQIPKALHFNAPLGTERGALTAKVAESSAADAGGAPVALGEDLAGIGGGNTSLGDPVFAAADGLVLLSGEGPPEMGKVVLLGHTAPDGSALQTLYAHLDQTEQAPGTLVARGARIGSVGTAGGRYPARLHFQLRSGRWLEIGEKTAATLLNRQDPQATLAAFGSAQPEQPTPSPLARALSPDAEAWTSLEISNAERLAELHGGDEPATPEPEAKPEPEPAPPEAAE